VKGTAFTEIQDRFQAAIAVSVDMPIEIMGRVETVVIPEAPRAGSDMAVAYHVGAPTLIRTDPALLDALKELADPTRAIAPGEFRHWAADLGWKFVDGADQHVISRDKLRVPSFPSGVRLVGPGRESLDDRALIAGLLDASDPDDVSEAEFAMDGLDPHIVGLVDEAGAMIAMASGRIWENDSDFDDIGVLTRPDRRGQGLGGTVVAAFCIESFDRLRLPLYRCNWNRVASKALAVSLGFELVGQLTAVASNS
jgi:GNAT superfamily N-acetyltransferase